MITIFVFDENIPDMKQMRESMRCETWWTHCVVRWYQNKRRLLEEVGGENGDPDIVFLSLSGRSESAIEIGKELKRYKPEIQLIFLAECEDHLLLSCEVEHAYLLMKPVKRLLLRKAFFMAVRRISENSDPVLPIVTRGQTYCVRRKEILYLEKELRLIHAHTDEGVITFYGKFDDIREYLTAAFCQCHNSYVVNLDRVVGLENRMFHLENGEYLAISQKRYQQVRQYYQNYLKSRNL